MGRAGRDWLTGGGGKDTLLGQTDGDELWGGSARDYVYGGPGDDFVLGDQSASRGRSRAGDDVIYGGVGADLVIGAFEGGQRDELYCGEGRDEYLADGHDYVSSSCEVRFR